MKLYSPPELSKAQKLVLDSIIIVTIILLVISIGLQNVDGFEKVHKSREVFLGNMQTDIPNSLRLSFTTFSLIDEPVNSTIKAKVGNEKILLTGNGEIEIHYKDGDRQCKSLVGSQDLISKDGTTGFKMLFYGKACHMGQNFNIFSGKFSGSDGKGIFNGKQISGTLTGTMNYGETIMNLKIKSSLLYDG